MKSPLSIVMIAVVGLAGLSSLAYALLHWQISDPLSYAALFVAGLVASAMKLRLPRVNSSMSMNLPFFVLALAQASVGEAVVLGCCGILLQTLLRRGKMSAVQVFFNFANMALSMLLAGMAGQQPFAAGAIAAVAAAVLFLCHTVPVSVMIALSEGGSLWRIWSQIARLSFAYYLLAGGLVAMLQMASIKGWQASLLALPLMLGVYSSYLRYFSQEAKAQEPLKAAAAAATN